MMNFCSAVCSRATRCLAAIGEKTEDFFGRPSNKRALGTAMIVGGLALPILGTATVPLSVLWIGAGIWAHREAKSDERACLEEGIAHLEDEERLIRRKIEMEKETLSNRVDLLCRPRSLIVLAASDHNGAFEKRERELLSPWLSTTAATVVYASRVRDLETLNPEVLNRAAFLFVEGHSDGTEIQLGRSKQADAWINSRHLIELVRKMPRLTDLVFNGCYTAKPGGIGQEVSRAFPHLRVSGPSEVCCREASYFSNDQRPMVITLNQDDEWVNATECTVVWEAGEAITRKVQLPAIAEYLPKLSAGLAHTRLGSTVFYAQGQICEQEQEPEKAIAVYRSTQWGEEDYDDLKKKAEKRAAALSEQLARIEYCFM